MLFLVFMLSDLVFMLSESNSENPLPAVYQCWNHILLDTGICGDMYGRITPAWKSECMTTVAKVCELNEKIK